MTRGLAFPTMKICIALTTLSGRSPDRFGDFYKVALPGIEGRSPFLFRCKPEAEGDDRYFYLPGDEAAFNKDMSRLMKDSRFNSWGMCVFAIPSDDTAPATGSQVKMGTPRPRKNNGRPSRLSSTRSSRTWQRSAR